MDLPAGTKLEEGLETSAINFQEKLVDLMSRDFNGYIIITIEVSDNINEAILLMKKGILIGAYYEYNKEKNEFGEKALPLALNAGLAPYGIIDINSLSGQQLDLIIAFQEKIVLETEVRQKDLTKLMPKQYTPVLTSVQKTEKSKDELFKKLGLSGF